MEKEKCSEKEKVYEPLLKNRFLVEFKTKHLNKIIPQSIKMADRPKLKDGVWGDMVIKFRGFIGSEVNASRPIMNLIYDLKNEVIDDLSIEYNLNLLDPTGCVVQSWLIKGVITTIDFTELDYDGKSEMTSVVMVIKPSEVMLNY